MSTRQPQVTREQILQAAYQAVYEHGLNATSLDDILARTGVSKGALYHHFEGKQALGGAIVDAVLSARVRESGLDPIAGGDDPIGALQRLLRGLARRPAEDVLRYGCPIQNLAAEISSLDEQLRTRVDAVLARWIEGVRDALRAGQAAETVDREVDAQRAATFVVASIEGTLTLVKASRDPRVLRAGFEELAAYLDTLRPRAAARAARR